MDKLFKSILASILIGMGVAVNLNLGAPIGPFLFAFGLLAVCYTDSLLYTGRVGFMWRDNKLDVLYILLVNIMAGIMIGVCIGFGKSDLVAIAQDKMSYWTLSPEFFVQSIMCGIIMYLCVYLYKKGTCLGILIGVPLFIFCGFQHSIANSITFGIGMFQGDILTILLSAVGNGLGSIIIDILINGWKSQSDITE